MNTNTLSEITALWKRVLDALSQKINDSRIFNAFFKDTYIYSINSKEIIVACNSSLTATILHDKYKDLVDKTVYELTGTDFDVAFINEEDLKSKDIDKIISQNKPKFLQNCELSPNYTFDNFVVGPSNKEASQASLIVASNLGQLYNPLFLYSQSGLGKTHLLNAIGNYIREQNPTTKILYCSSQTFFEEYQQSIHNQADSEAFKEYIKSFDILLVDDIQFFQNKKSTEEFFFNVFEHMRNNKKQLVLTSDRSPSELRELDPRLQTRFASGLQISILKPTTDMCKDILKKKIEATGLSLSMFSDDVIYLLADKFKNSIRDLEGALNRLLFYANMNHADYIDLEIAIDALQSLIDIGDSKSKVSVQKILNVTASYYNLSVSQITGKIKTSQIVNARHIAIYLIRNLLDISLKQIGETFSNRDHTTIMHSINKVEEMLKTNNQTKVAIDELKKRISS
jgi:chromosomal replication initiator protein